MWSHEVSNNDKGEFIRAMFEVLRDYDLLTDDWHDMARCASAAILTGRSIFAGGCLNQRPKRRLTINLVRRSV